jgi:NADH:ubiquinone oxidoreductase subunit 3 (subunit A)
MVLLILAFSWLLQPRRGADGDKPKTYECGEIPETTAWVQFLVIYYLFALLFVLFDVEVVFVIPWAVVLRQLKTRVPELPGLSLFAFGEMLVFLVILAIGLLYAWRKGILKWEQLVFRAEAAPEPPRQSRIP